MYKKENRNYKKTSMLIYLNYTYCSYHSKFTFCNSQQKLFIDFFKS